MKQLVRSGALALAIIGLIAAPMPASAASAASAAAVEQRPVLLQLGDSVAAGAGLELVEDATPEDQTCRRSSEAYVHDVAGALGMEAVNLACSGATTWNGLITDQEVGGGEIRSQLKQTYAGVRPDTAIVTIGANDVRWARFLSICANRRLNCATNASTQTFEQLLRPARAGLWSTIAGLEFVGARRVLVTGYYDPFVGNAVTASEAGLDPAEIEWYQERRAQLNAALEQVANRFANAAFVPIDLAETGGQLIQGPDDPAPLHPTPAGQAQIASIVATAAE